MSMWYTWKYYYNIIVYTVKVGLAATRLIHEKWFRINNYYINQMVTTLFGSAVCPESYMIWLIVTFVVYTYCLFVRFQKINIHSFIHSLPLPPMQRPRLVCRRQNPKTEKLGTSPHKISTCPISTSYHVEGLFTILRPPYVHKCYYNSSVLPKITYK